MIDFLKRYLHLAGDENDTERKINFTNKFNDLSNQSLHSLYNIEFMIFRKVNMLLNMKSEIFVDGKWIDLPYDHFYVKDKDIVNMENMVCGMLQVFASLKQYGLNYTIDDQREGISLCNDYLPILSFFCQNSDYRSYRGIIFDVLSKYELINKHELCDFVDFVENADTTTPLEDVQFALKKILLSRDEFNLAAYRKVRKIILRSPFAAHLRKFLTQDDNDDSFFDILQTDIFLLNDVFGNFDCQDNQFRYPNINQDDVLYLIDFTLYLIYLRWLLKVFTLLVSDLPSPNLFKHDNWIFPSVKYSEMGLYCFANLVHSFSIPDIFLLIFNEYSFQFTHRLTFENPLYKMEHFEKFINYCRQSFRGSKYDKIINQLKIDAENMVREDENLFHTDVIKKLETEKSYKKYFKEEKFVKKARSTVKELFTKLGIGNIRGVSKK